MILNAAKTRILNVTVRDDTLMIDTRVEYKHPKTYQYSTHKIPLSDLQKVNIQRLDRNRTTCVAIITGVTVTLFTLGLIFGDFELLFSFLLDML